MPNPILAPYQWRSCQSGNLGGIGINKIRLTVQIRKISKDSGVCRHSPSLATPVTPDALVTPLTGRVSAAQSRSQGRRSHQSLPSQGKADG
jgi:hypothetical protein